MRRTPRNMHKVPDGQVFDADKSVRWNREQVLRNNEKYYDEVKRLTLEKTWNRKRFSVMCTRRSKKMLDTVFLAKRRK